MSATHLYPDGKAIVWYANRDLTSPDWSWADITSHKELSSTALRLAVAHLQRQVFSAPLKYVCVCVTLRSGHGGDVTDVAWSPDGTRIVTASIDNTAIIWNVRTGPDTKHCDSLALKSISPYYYTQHLPI